MFGDRIINFEFLVQLTGVVMEAVAQMQVFALYSNLAEDWVWRYPVSESGLGVCLD